MIIASLLSSMDCVVDDYCVTAVVTGLCWGDYCVTAVVTGLCCG